MMNNTSNINSNLFINNCTKIESTSNIITNNYTNWSCPFYQYIIEDEYDIEQFVKKQRYS